MTARHRLPTRARGNRRYVPRHAAWSRFRSVDAHVAAALGNETVRLGDVWKNEALTFEERRDEITKRLKATRWYRSDCGEVADVVDDIQNATTVSRFDIAWGDLYDLADEDRVWIDIYSVPA